MKTGFLTTVMLLVFLLPVRAQDEIPIISQIDLKGLPPQSQHRFWLKMIDNGLAQPICVPVLILKGESTHPVVGMTAAIHGNELNGIPIIQQLVQEIDVKDLKGTIIAIPGLNAVSLTLHQRTFFDETDLNRIFPGKKNGNRSEQYVWAINQKILTQLDYLIDLHTASFGRENCLYVRAELDDAKMAKMASWQEADIILSSSGAASVNASSTSRTMRAEAMLKGIATITIELGNPQVYQEDLIERGLKGVKNTIRGLGLIDTPLESVSQPVFCKKSYWIYIDQGGYLEVPVALKQRLKKGDTIGILRNPFGDIIKTYTCPEDGIVIGKSSNPVNMSGGRIIHLGILDEQRN